MSDWSADVCSSVLLLGGPSGSGVATTVTLGSIAWPMLKRAGYRAEDAGGLLAAGGLGAIMSPPVLGAAAFLIAEFLGISYLDVIRMATVPTCFYYLALFIMVELDAGRFGIQNVDMRRRERSEEHTSELQSLMRISYAVFCLKKKQHIH